MYILTMTYMLISRMESRIILTGLEDRLDKSAGSESEHLIINRILVQNEIL
jgi:hypothetical protein